MSARLLLRNVSTNQAMATKTTIGIPIIAPTGIMMMAQSTEKNTMKM